MRFHCVSVGFHIALYTLNACYGAYAQQTYKASAPARAG